MITDLPTRPPEADVTEATEQFAIQAGLYAKQLPQRSWTDAFAKVPGHKERRRYRRSQQRDKVNAVKRANRRRFLTYESNRMAVTTLKQQVRIFDGIIGTPKQRERVTAQFTRQARELGQPVDEVVDALRTGLGLAG